MENKLIVSCSPHLRSQNATPRVMLDVILALLPAAVAGVILYGIRSLWVILVSVGAAVLAEFLFCLITKKPQTVGDFSAAVTGLLLGLNLHANVALWQCAVGAVFAVVVIKCLFGGLGCNFANPAITGRIFLLLCFADATGGGAPSRFQAAELVSSATPLEILNSGSQGTLPSLLDMFLGNRSGAIGEACVLALLLGFCYLVIRRIIHWETPLIFIGTVFLLSLIVKGDLRIALYEILSGGLVLGAVFMATDYVTTPITRTGKMLFAFGCGVITVLIRFFGSYPEGVSFSILLMNILSPYLEKWTAKRPLGAAKKRAGKEGRQA